MSEEQQLQVSKLIDKEVETKRMVAWSGFGKQLYHGEIVLQFKQQAIIAKLIAAPKTPEEIKAAEQALALVKKERSELVEERKTYTARFDSVITRLMQPEKEINEAIAANELAIIKAKQDEKESLKTTENKEKELKQIAEHVRVYVADMHAAYLKAQLQLLSDAYKHALTSQIPLEGIQAYITKFSARINIENRTTPLPKPVFKYNTQEQVDAEIKKHFNPWTAQEYVDGFAIDAKNKFSDWATALKNTETAVVLNTEEFNETTAAIDDQQQKETVAAKLDAIAMPLLEGGSAGVKDLKVKYKIQDPETLEQAFNIMNAFIVNKKTAVPELNKIKPVNLGVKQMMGALEELKNKDNNFEVTGITFIKTEKL